MRAAMKETAVDTPFASEATRRAAVRRRDPAADGHFYYSVLTTGVYCRPSCAARPARPENIGFHTTRADAEKAGFRPCKRCRPDLAPKSEREAALIAQSCRAIEAAEEAPALAELAAQVGMSPHHFHRTFKRIAGVTPKAYADAHRQRLVQDSLRAGSGVTEAIYAAGYNSSGRFYAAAPEMLGMTPTAYRSGGAGEAVRYAVGRCTLGRVLVAATERGVCAIFLGDEPAPLVTALQERFPKARLTKPEPEFAQWVDEVVRFVDDPARSQGFGLPLDIRGTAFQRKVWEALRQIPAGATTTYSDLAARLGQPKAVRAVGSACGANPLAVVIPCHRAVAMNGGLAGYRWGLERKRRLLARERG
jgi:AraC family transcriptional regulator, regulatory protein of adaptative response / methylated-DNA-[protein]-cysteine methyltransferase